MCHSRFLSSPKWGSRTIGKEHSSRRYYPRQSGRSPWRSQKVNMNTTDYLPDDETGSALRRYVMEGSDLTRPMLMDFFVLVPSENAGKKVADAAQELGYSTSVEYDQQTEAWTCYCTKTIVPSYNAVTQIEEQLDLIAQGFGGRIDGFGSFGNAGETSRER